MGLLYQRPYYKRNLYDRRVPRVAAIPGSGRRRFTIVLALGCAAAVRAPRRCQRASRC